LIAGPLVMVPKESRRDTPAMNHDPRPHVHRRRRAIERLRSLTTGTAVAGLAGVAGFGVLAAATWSGDPSAVGATDAGSTSSGSGGGGPVNGPATVQTNPSRVTTPQNPTVTKPRVQRVSGTGHATTGGSH
jgi:hypothetical protein